MIAMYTFILFVMIAKPDLLQSCAIVIVANAMAAALLQLTAGRPAAVALDPVQ